jgi:hypothetical protein
VPARGRTHHYAIAGNNVSNTITRRILVNVIVI